MSKLIYKSEVIDLLKNSVSADIEEVIVTDKNIKLIESMPCAYNVDAVVAELEKAESVKNFGSVNSRNLLIPLNDAIDIVKAGGVK